jgi:predicted RNase H-like nuclease (RuvC/YqgF family)
VSGGAARRSERALPKEVDGLELSVRRLMDRYEVWRRRAQAAERKVEQLQSAVKRLSSGGPDPLKLQQRTEALQAENEDLRRRMVEAHERIEKMIGRFEFLQEER